MERPTVIYQQDKLNELLSKDSIISDILKDIAENKCDLSKEFQFVGVANNVLLGVFGIKISEDKRYSCYRLYYENHKLIVASVGFPVTNLGGEYTIECNMNYIISIRTLKMVTAALNKQYKK